MSEVYTGTERGGVRATVAGAAFTALTAVGAYISIPIGPVPIVLQNFFVILAGLLLGPKRGLVSVGLYLLIGAIGLPVFAGGTGGIGHFFGPTGGYLIGFLPAVFLAGVLSRGVGERSSRTLQLFFAALAGTAAIYLVGLPWLKVATSMGWKKSVLVGLIPFILGDLLKILAAVFTARSIEERFDAFLGGLD